MIFMSNDDLSKRMDAQDQMLSAIHTALIGNGALGNKGLVKRVEDVEIKVDGHSRTMLKWTGIATGAALAVNLLKDKIIGGQ